MKTSYRNNTSGERTAAITIPWIKLSVTKTLPGDNTVGITIPWMITVIVKIPGENWEYRIELPLGRDSGSYHRPSPGWCL